MSSFGSDGDEFITLINSVKPAPYFGQKSHSSVLGIVDFLDLSKTAVVVDESWLVERFRLIEAVSIRSTLLIAVHVLLGVPARAVPQSGVAGVSAGDGVKGSYLVVSVSPETRLALDRSE